MPNNYDGGYYHLFNRGNNKEKIFLEISDYNYFLKQFYKYLAPHIDVFAYCLMPNHFHFFIRINDSSRFDIGIKNFLISYSKTINKKYGRVGSLFQGTYKLSEIKTNTYFTRIITYIHQNPLVAGLSKSMEEYRFSSYKAYLLNEKTSLKKEEVLEWFGGINSFIEAHKLIIKGD
ncbi:MAG: transposase [Daejeonella sp.]|uniref:transposase n=1 Tax=Daejeonella sp. TaxID=2805397 RepID=UPI00273683AC|nr:transposase [Daejeonella sp.]MDP3468949.1 transposase [Daejeonella sp.]